MRMHAKRVPSILIEPAARRQRFVGNASPPEDRKSTPAKSVARAIEGNPGITSSCGSRSELATLQKDCFPTLRVFRYLTPIGAGSHVGYWVGPLGAEKSANLIRSTLDARCAPPA